MRSSAAARHLAILWVAAMLLSTALGILSPVPARPAAARPNDTPTGEVCAPLASNMVAWWRGNNDATDSLSVGPHHGTLVNGATFAPGYIGQAFSLDGVDDYVQVPDHANLTPPSNSLTVEAWIKADDLTKNHLIMSKYDSQQGGISWILMAKTNGYLRFGVYHNVPGQVGRVIDTTFPIINPGPWHHVAATFDLSSQQIKIYVAGIAMSVQFVSGLDWTIPYIYDSTTPVRIGTFADSSGTLLNHWDGLIDEVGFYDRALSAAEVQAIHEAGTHGHCSSSTAETATPTETATSTTTPTQDPNEPSPTPCSNPGGGPGGGGSPPDPTSTPTLNPTTPTLPPCDDGGSNPTSTATATATSKQITSTARTTATDAAGTPTTTSTATPTATGTPTARTTPSCPTADMVAWWRGENNADDSAGPHHGTLVNGASFASGYVGAAFSLDGVNDYVTIPDYESLTPPSNSLTVHAWVKPDDVTQKGSIVTKYHNVSGEISWSLVVEAGGYVRFAVYENTINMRAMDTVNPVISAGVWQHVAGTFDLGSQQIKIYVNGIEEPVQFVAGHSATIKSIRNSTSPVRIGTFVNVDGDLIDFWDGLIDEVALYDRALSAEELLAIYRIGAQCSLSRQLLPLVLKPAFPVAINSAAIDARPVAQQGESFYSASVQMPSSLPAGGSFYLSSAPDTLKPTLVDDQIVLREGGTTIFSFNYSANGDPTAAPVKVPRAVLEPVAGQTLDVEFVDVYGGLVGATPVYMIWVP